MITKFERAKLHFETSNDLYIERNEDNILFQYDHIGNFSDVNYYNNIFVYQYYCYNKTVSFINVIIK